MLVAPQLSVAVGSTNGGCCLQTVPVIVDWPVTSGGVLSTFLVVAGDSQPVGAAVPAGIFPQTVEVM